MPRARASVRRTPGKNATSSLLTAAGGDGKNLRMSKETYRRVNSSKVAPEDPIAGSPHSSLHRSMSIEDVEGGTKESGANIFDEKQMALVEQRTANMEIRKRAAIRWLRERKLRKEAVLSGVVYICFMSLYFFVVLEQARVWDAHQLEVSLRDYLTSVDDGNGVTFDSVSNDEEIWSWLENGLLDALFPEPQWYNGQEWATDESNFIMHYNRLVGGFKMVQRRIQENWDGCVRSNRFDAFYGKCWPGYSDPAKDTMPFGPAHDPEKFIFESDAWGGGYMVELSLDRKLAFETIQELKKDLWTDKNTRQIAVEFIIYNGNMRLFTLVNAEINTHPTGKVDQSYTMETFRVELYSDYRDWIRFACEIVFLFFVAATFFFEMKEFLVPPVEFGVRVSYREHFKKYWRSFWNWSDQIRIGMFLTIIVKYALILTHDDAERLQLPLPADQTFARLDGLAKAWREYKRLNGFNVVLCLLTIFKFMNKSPRYGILVRTISRATPDLIKFMIMFVLCLMCFAIMGILLFGAALVEWSTPWTSVQTLFMMITGEYGYDPVMSVDPVGAPIFYFLFLVIVFFLLVNILLAIMMDAYATLREDMKQEADEMQHKYDFPILQEFYMQTMAKAAEILPYWERPIFLRTRDILKRLEENETLLEKSILDFPPATVNNPDPEPEEIISWELLRDVYSADQARFMMIFVGVPVPDDSVIRYTTDDGSSITNSGSSKNLPPTLEESDDTELLPDDSAQGYPLTSSDLEARVAGMEATLQAVSSSLHKIAGAVQPPSNGTAHNGSPVTESFASPSHLFTADNISDLNAKMDLVLHTLKLQPHTPPEHRASSSSSTGVQHPHVPEISESE